MTQTAAQQKAQAAALKAEGVSSGNGTLAQWMKIWCFQENALGQFVQSVAFVPIYHYMDNPFAYMRVGPNPNSLAKNANETLLPVYADGIRNWMERVTPQLMTQAQSIGHRLPESGLLFSLLRAEQQKKDEAAIDKFQKERRAAIAAKRAKTRRSTGKPLKLITVTKETRKTGRFKATGKG